ncbi:MAG: GNAT family N-acetyltransferase [Acidobacteria bacterium]|nr:GNAT family N-acetyltransferase [Acidobacteriota bacterium]
MKHAMPIVTPRLILRPPTLADLDAIQTAKEEVWHDLQLWMSWAHDDQRPRSALEAYIRQTMDYQNRDSVALCGFERTTGEFAVSTGLELSESEPGVYETGYWVARKFRDRGIATEAATAAIRYAFHHLSARSITIGYLQGNEASRRIVEKLGFTKLRVLPEGAVRCLDGTRLDRHEYAMASPASVPELKVTWV